LKGTKTQGSGSAFETRKNCSGGRKKGVMEKPDWCAVGVHKKAGARVTLFRKKTRKEMTKNLGSTQSNKVSGGLASEGGGCRGLGVLKTKTIGHRRGQNKYELTKERGMGGHDVTREPPEKKKRPGE